MSELLDRSKRKQLEAMLRMGRGLVMVHLDPRREGVVVPDRFASDPVLRLNLAHGFNLPAFDIDDNRVHAILSFGGYNFGCTLPWRSIFAMTRPAEAHAGVAWPDSAPPEARSSLLQSDLEILPRPTHLRAVEDPPEEAPEEAPEDETDRVDAASTSDEPRRPPTLRLVD